jgi:hypothetical protein
MTFNVKVKTCLGTTFMMTKHNQNCNAFYLVKMMGHDRIY